jgi:hypothetical protein
MHTGRKLGIRSGIKVWPAKPFAAHYDFDEENDVEELWWCVSAQKVRAVDECELAAK